MRTDEVTQAPSTLLDGQARVVYAVDAQGQYQKVASSGWQPEEDAGLDEVNWFSRLAAETYQQAQQGQASALAYHMYRLRMDPQILAQATGLWGWRVKRHLQPKHFSKLSAKLLQRYADCLGLSVAQLQSLEPAPVSTPSTAA